MSRAATISMTRSDLMMRNVTGCVLISCALAASHLSAADAQRFSEHAETTIGVSVGDQEFTARLWIGRTRVTSTSRGSFAADVIAIYLPNSKLWWALTYTN